MGDVPVAIIDTTGGVSVNYMTADQLDTPRAVSNSAGTTIWIWRYTGNPFGESARTNAGSTYTLNLRYPGQYFNAESGLISNGFRDCYDPATGRYCQSDPTGIKGGISTYAYVGNNPLSYIDPYGLNYAQKYAVVGAAAGGMITAGASLVADVFTFGTNVVATGPEIAGGAAIGGGLGYGLGSALDWATGQHATASDNAYDPNGPKAPGKPGVDEGFVDPKSGESRVPNPNPGAAGASHGWEDSKGRVWCPTGQGPRAHGGPHWDVQDPKSGGNTNVRPGQNINNL